MEVDVKEAARRLGINASRVRQLLRSGDLRGRRLGNQWLIPAEDVARLVGNRRGPGRPLAPKRAWAVLDLLDGGRAAWLSDSARSQVRRYLADLVAPKVDNWRAALRARSRVLDVVAHPAAIDRLGRVNGVLAVGPLAAVDRGFDLVALAEPVPEFYVAEERWPDLERSLALREGPEANLRIRLPNEVWPFVDAASEQGEVGDAVLAADLLDAAEPRAVAAGAARLDELLAEWQRDRALG
ncbi:helix-turn-helix domain-containing protein [Nocardioides sp. YIM 152588]|uniref:helix-turn-helix domain-containing protein n=1 Tax=Nocardioides sp. YIM 152588 TaxID=3158259 RepID=UPI0032E37E1E